MFLYVVLPVLGFCAILDWLSPNEKNDEKDGE